MVVMMVLRCRATAATAFLGELGLLSSYDSPPPLDADRLALLAQLSPNPTNFTEILARSA